MQGGIAITFAIAGAMYWAVFLRGGDIHTFDWVLYEPILGIIKLMVSEVRLPYFASMYCGVDPYNLQQRFFKAPWLIASPDILLLRWLPVSSWIVVHVVACYWAGVAGMWVWIRRLNLSVFATLFVLIVFTLNGFFSAKIAAGHLGDLSGYFSAPWVLWFWVEFSENSHASARQLGRLALRFVFFLTALLLCGALHPIQWIVLGGVIALLGRPRALVAMLGATLSAILMASYLFVPLAFYSGYGQTRPIASGFGGFREPLTIIWSSAKALLGSIDRVPMGLWETTVYVSWLGAGLIVFGLIRARRQVQPAHPLLVGNLKLAAGLLAVLMLGSTMRWVGAFWVWFGLPVLDQYPSRAVIFVVTWGTLAAAPFLEGAFERLMSGGVRWLAKTATLGVLLFLLAKNSWAWSVHATSQYWTGNANNQPLYLLCPEILANVSDDRYVRLVNGGFLLSVVAFSLAVVTYVLLRDRSVAWKA